MRDYIASTYGDAIADVYDDGSFLAAPADGSRAEETTAAVDFLAQRAGAGPVLELGVGTGRIALPLAATRDVEVHGIEVSQAMIDQLRAKPGADAVTIHRGEIARMNPPGPFTLVYIVANTLYCLTTQDEQVSCIRKVADRLGRDGRFVVEAFVPDPSRYDRGQRLEVHDIATGGVHLDATRQDRATQTLASQQVVITTDGVRLFPVHIRYVWPAELDLMCALAGLRLEQRHGGWVGQPFTSASSTHVSVYTPAET